MVLCVVSPGLSVVDVVDATTVASLVKKKDGKHKHYYSKLQTKLIQVCLSNANVFFRVFIKLLTLH